MELDPKLAPKPLLERIVDRWKLVLALAGAVSATAGLGEKAVSWTVAQINAPLAKRIRILERRTYRLCLDVAQDQKTLERCAKMARKLQEEEDE